MDFFFGNQEFLHQKFPFTLNVCWEAFFGSQCSTSYAPDEQEALYTNFERSAQMVFNKYCSEGGVLEVHGVTELNLGKMTSLA